MIPGPSLHILSPLSTPPGRTLHELKTQTYPQKSLTRMFLMKSRVLSLLVPKPSASVRQHWANPYLPIQKADAAVRRATRSTPYFEPTARWPLT